MTVCFTWVFQAELFTCHAPLRLVSLFAAFLNFHLSPLGITRSVVGFLVQECNDLVVVKRHSALRDFTSIRYYSGKVFSDII